MIFPPILSSETERALYEVRTRKLKNLISPCASDLQQCASEVLSRAVITTAQVRLPDEMSSLMNGLMEQTKLYFSQPSSMSPLMPQSENSSRCCVHENSCFLSFAGLFGNFYAMVSSTQERFCSEGPFMHRRFYRHSPNLCATIIYSGYVDVEIPPVCLDSFFSFAFTQ